MVEYLVIAAAVLGALFFLSRSLRDTLGGGGWLIQAVRTQLIGRGGTANGLLR